MSMNKIGGQQSLPSRTLESLTPAPQRKEAQANPGGYSSDGTQLQSLATGDRAVISEKARQLMAIRQAYDQGLEAISREPDVRQSKLAEVRERMEQGYYESPQVRDKISEGLLRALGSMDET